jgi:hypothetical protein
MQKSLRWKFALIVAVTVACVVGVMGFPPSVDKMRKEFIWGWTCAEDAPHSSGGYR